MRNLVSLLCISILACHGQSEPASGVAPASSTVCPPAAIPTVAIDSAEPGLLAASDGQAWRANTKLYLHRLDGDTTTLTDAVGDSLQADEVVRHFYRGLVRPLHAFEVAFVLWEGSGTLLVDAHSGVTIGVWGSPLLSPDGRRFATISNDLDAAYIPTGLQIWRVGSRVPTLEWQKELKNWGPVAAAWENDSTIVIAKEFPLGSSTRDGAACALLTDRGDVWQLRD